MNDLEQVPIEVHLEAELALDENRAAHKFRPSDLGFLRGPPPPFSDEVPDFWSLWLENPPPPLCPSLSLVIPELPVSLPKRRDE